MTVWQYLVATLTAWYHAWQWRVVSRRLYRLMKSRPSREEVRRSVQSRRTINECDIWEQHANRLIAFDIPYRHRGARNPHKTSFVLRVLPELRNPFQVLFGPLPFILLDEKVNVANCWSLEGVMNAELAKERLNYHFECLGNYRNYVCTDEYARNRKNINLGRRNCIFFPDTTVALENAIENNVVTTIDPLRRWKAVSIPALFVRLTRLTLPELRRYMANAIRLHDMSYGVSLPHVPALHAMTEVQADTILSRPPELYTSDASGDVVGRVLNMESRQYTTARHRRDRLHRWEEAERRRCFRHNLRVCKQYKLDPQTAMLIADQAKQDEVFLHSLSQIAPHLYRAIAFSSCGKQWNNLSYRTTPLQGMLGSDNPIYLTTRDA